MLVVVLACEVLGGNSCSLTNVPVSMRRASRMQVVALAREVLGGNGVQADFHVAKQFCDMEAIYTYEVRALNKSTCVAHGISRFRIWGKLKFE
jgi:hypothetical protein